MDLVSRRRLGGARLRPERRNPHGPHQPLHALAVDPVALSAQHRRHPARAEERPGREHLVEPPHQAEIIVVGRLPRSVDARARNAEQCALPADQQPGMAAVEQVVAVRRAHRPDLLDKNPAPRSVGRSWRRGPRPSSAPASRQRRPHSGRRRAPRSRAAASSRRKSGSGGPRSAGRDLPPSPAPAAPPRRSSPSAPHRSCVSSSSGFAPSSTTERPLLQSSHWSQNPGPLQGSELIGFLGEPVS
jgi:hypothetical protein